MFVYLPLHFNKNLKIFELKEKSFYKNYDIRFAGIGFGEHHFAFDLNSAFLKHYDPEFEDDISIQLDFTINKVSEVFFELGFLFNGHLNCYCDRCLNKIDYPFHSNHKMFLKVGHSSSKAPEDEDIIYAGPYDYTINIADNIHDFVLFQIPVRKTCDMVGDKCDPEMIKKLEEFTISSEKKSQSIDYENNELN